MNGWEKTATEQAKFGNKIPEDELNNQRQILNFQPRKSFNVGGQRGVLPEHGHMTFLKKLDQDRQEIILITSLGYIVRGFVKAVDEQSISLRCLNKSNEGENEGGYRTRVIFKSNIIEFSPVRGIENLADKLEQQGWLNPMTFDGFGEIEKHLNSTQAPIALL